MALLVCGCGGDGSSPDAPVLDADLRDAAPADAVDPGGDPTGAWSRDGTLFACFDDSWYAAFGDSPEDVLTPSVFVSWSLGGTLYFQQGGGTGQWRIIDGELVVWIDPPCEQDCGPVRYQSDTSLECFDF